MGVWEYHGMSDGMGVWQYHSMSVMVWGGDSITV